MGRAFSRVCLFVRALKGKRLELSIPNLVHIVVARHASTQRSKGQWLRSHGYETVTVARLPVTCAATAVCCCCRRGSACRYDCLCFLVAYTRLQATGILLYRRLIFAVRSLDISWKCRCLFIFALYRVICKQFGLVFGIVDRGRTLNWRRKRERREYTKTNSTSCEKRCEISVYYLTDALCFYLLALSIYRG